MTAAQPRHSLEDTVVLEIHPPSFTADLVWPTCRPFRTGVVPEIGGLAFHVYCNDPQRCIF